MSVYKHRYIYLQVWVYLLLHPGAATPLIPSNVIFVLFTQCSRRSLLCLKHHRYRYPYIKSCGLHTSTRYEKNDSASLYQYIFFFQYRPLYQLNIVIVIQIIDKQKKIANGVMFDSRPRHVAANTWYNLLCISLIADWL